MAFYVDCAFLHDIMDVPMTEEAVERFTLDWQMMKNL